ncbi:hypothetical protein, partial [Nocardia carnea]|uniref:hypothetical protein n=1 Tax=Nocardia carnea TaxID=37328 RepID=UPI002454724C
PALPAPPTLTSALPVPEWGTVTADLSDMVVIVGAGELGPYGAARAPRDLGRLCHPVAWASVTAANGGTRLAVTAQRLQ